MLRKMAMLRCLFIPASIFAAPPGPEPAGRLTLQEAQRLALDRNPVLAAASWEVQARESAALQAGLRANPELMLEMENFSGTGDLAGFRNAETTVGVGQLFELGGKRAKRRHLTSLARDLAEWDRETLRLDVFAEATRSFVTVLAAQQAVELQLELVRVAEESLESVARQIKAGAVSPVEEARARVALAATRLDLEDARRELAAARLSLAATWGSVSPSFESAEGELAPPQAPPPFEVLAGRVSANPDLARWNVEMEERRAAVALAASERIPDLTAAGGLRRFHGGDASALTLGVGIPLPLVNRNQGGIREARQRLAQADFERRAAEVSARTLLGITYEGLLRTYRETTTLRDELLPEAERAYAMTSESYRRGLIRYLEVLDAQRTLFELRGREIAALADYHRTVAELERLVGEPLAGIETRQREP